MTNTTNTAVPALSARSGKRIHTSAIAHGWRLLDTMTVAGDTVASYKCNDLIIAVHLTETGYYLSTQVFRETPNALYQINLLDTVAAVLDLIEEQAADRAAR